MRSHSLSMMVVGAALVALLAGCTAANTFPTVQDVKDFAKEERETIKALEIDLTKQHLAQHPEASGAIIASATAFRAEMGEIAKRVEAMEGSLKPFLEKGLSGVLAMIGKLAGIDLPLVDTFQKQDAKTDANKQKSDTNTAAIDDLEKWAADVKAAAAKRDAQEREIRARLAALDQDTREKFSRADKETIAKLNELKKDRAAFDKELQRQFKLTDAQMAELKGMSPEQIISIIAAAVAAAGVGVAGGKTGKSRSEPKVEAMAAKLDDVIRKMEK